METFTCEVLSSEHVPALLELISSDPSAPFHWFNQGIEDPQEFFAHLLSVQESEGIFWVSYLSGEIVGFFGVSRREWLTDPATLSVKTYVSHKARGHGLNYGIMRSLIALSYFLPKFKLVARVSKQNVVSAGSFSRITSGFSEPIETDSHYIFPLSSEEGHILYDTPTFKAIVNQLYSDILGSSWFLHRYSNLLEGTSNG